MSQQLTMGLPMNMRTYETQVCVKVDGRRVHYSLRGVEAMSRDQAIDEAIRSFMEHVHFVAVRDKSDSDLFDRHRLVVNSYDVTGFHSQAIGPMKLIRTEVWKGRRYDLNSEGAKRDAALDLENNLDVTVRLSGE